MSKEEKKKELTKSDLEKKIAEYRKQETQLSANLHATQGAIQAIELMLKDME
jgi:chaperonin cofactor prefoldin